MNSTKRYIAISYKLKIDFTELTGLTIHEVEKSEDIYVFAHNYLTSLEGVRRLFNTYFIGQGTAEVTITNVAVINPETFLIIQKLLQ